MIYFQNPHYGPLYGINVFNALTGRFDHKKYWFLSRHILGETEKDVGILINLNQNSFDMTFAYKVPVLNRMITLLEVIVWLLLNAVNPFKVPLRFSAKCLNENDIVFIFAYANMQREKSLIEDIARSPCTKVVHLTHYLFRTALIAANSEKMGKLFFVGESDLSKYPYFRHHFRRYGKEVYLLPFSPQPRFSKKTLFRERRMKCLAMGTLTLIKRNEDTRDFMDFFGTDCVHLMRKVIYENSDRLAGLVENSIGLANTDGLPRDVHAQRSLISKLYYAAWNFMKANRRKYYSFEVTDRFNQYAMAVIPEETNNLPGMGWVECMACGTAYIGIKDPMYTDLGLVPGEHYITYDNTLEGLIGAVKYYQSKPELLERIAENGRLFVAENLNGKTVAGAFLRDLRKLGEQCAREVPADKLFFFSSFRKEAK